MHLAIVNNLTNIVENTVVPPDEGQVWSPPDGYTAIETNTGSIGDIWDGVAFTKPAPQEP